MVSKQPPQKGMQISKSEQRGLDSNSSSVAGKETNRHIKRLDISHMTGRILTENADILDRSTNKDNK